MIRIILLLASLALGILLACGVALALPKKIAYVGFDGTDKEIYTIKASGGTAFEVTNNDTDDGAPSWGSLP
jgi:hypothetical protein